MNFAFIPCNYAFEWTEPTTDNPRDIGWYEWDYEEGHKLAKAARDAEWRSLKMQGLRTRRYSRKRQLIKKGGINCRRPSVEFVVTTYHVEAW